jgi:endonuclease/exonuclease/phosphatase (EEP) superfamily protein YafD
MRLKDKTYDHPEGPSFAGQYARATHLPVDALTVVTYNINFGLAVPQAIAAFQTFPPLQRAAIILLQEMDEHGVAHMAEALHYNFVYYPASVSHIHGRNFGNAVLARWPIVDARKLILPHRHPVRDQIRIAAQATVQMGDLAIAAYSVHTETYTVPAAYRRAQVGALVDAIATQRDNGPVIVGGDFNTVSRRSINRIVDQFAAAGLARTSAGAGPTVARLGVHATAADHIFTRGFTTLARGKVAKARASDHFPLWVDLAVPG